MEIETQLNGALPRLAWCARMEHGHKSVTVEHGPWVESTPGFFFEGAWSGPYTRDGLMASGAVVGSGGVAMGDSLVFIPGTHTMERLYSCRDGDRLYVANSFTYLLSVLEDGLDTRRLNYEAEFLSVLQGYHRMRPSIPTAGGRNVHFHCFLRLAVDSKLRMRTFPPAQQHRFDRYQDYVDHLETLTRDIIANARDDARQIKYEPLATVSTGYDSAACAVIARNCGCAEAVTFSSARMEHVGADVPSSTDDAGGAIADRLGLSVTEYDRTSYLARHDLPEAEFLASGSGGDDVVMSVLEPRLPGRIFFTGFRGDTIWGFDEQDPEDSARFKTKDPSGASMGEFRLRVGFIHVPLPALCMPYHGQILNISRQPEMAPWRLGNTYDRPIPRRIVETAGVPREAFGQEKKAITQPFWVTRDNVAMFSPTSRQALFDYSRALDARNRRRFPHRARTSWASFYLRVVWRADRIADRLPFRVPVRYPMAMRNLISQTGYRFHWAVEQIRARYASSRLGIRDAAPNAATAQLRTRAPD